MVTWKDLLIGEIMHIDLTFNIEYYTRWGEGMAVELLGPWSGIHDMRCVAPGQWQLDLQLEGSYVPEMQYRYIFTDADGNLRYEWGSPHSLHLTRGVGKYCVTDVWQQRDDMSPLTTKFFTGAVMRRDRRGARVIPHKGMLTLSVEAPLVDSNSLVAVVGSCEALGAWDPSQAVMMSDRDYPVWRVNIDAADVAGSEYKFVKLDCATGRVVDWEEGANRTLPAATRDINTWATVVNAGGFRLGARPWRGAGVAIPVFSLRSDNDCGVGDFMDLKEMVDWAVATGMKAIQLLPINDTTMTGSWRDSYPYNANSTMALHPMYLRLEDVGEVRDKAFMDQYDRERRRLNELQVIDYEQVNAVKKCYLERIYDQNGRDDMATPRYARFVAENRHWLADYAAFSVLRDVHDTADFTRWGRHATYTATTAAEVALAYPRETAMVYYIQYHLDRQLSEVKEYAASHGVALKGDIPIGISRTSVDAWAQPRLFNLDSQAGAPPDAFSANGQNWGFPTYNWDEMERDGYSWWRQRFEKMARHFDAYRIDHVLGFFRIWEIPVTAVHGLLGHFSPSLPMTPGEMNGRYGLDVDVDTLSRPLLSAAEIEEIAGDPALARDVMEKYMKESGPKENRKEGGPKEYRKEGGPSLYTPVAHYATQAQVAAHAAVLGDEVARVLLSLLDNVLFVEDPRRAGHFHPRIEGRDTAQYRRLTTVQQEAFDRLHEDYFYHLHDRLWQRQAMKKLPALVDATSMLTCAEDLGMIPSCVPGVMHELRMLSLEMQRMPKEMGRQFGDPSGYPYMSVSTTSTHDMEGIREWWESDPARARNFWHEALGLDGEPPLQATAWLCGKILTANLSSPAMLSILPWQDWMSIDEDLRRSNPADERINEPANSRHYWRYRMHMTLKSLNNAVALNARIKALIEAVER